MTSTPTTKIALDAMGGDNMPAAAIDGAIAAAQQGSRVILVGDEPLLRAELQQRSAAAPLLSGGQAATLEVVHAGDVISMDDHAADVRRRKDSSVMVAMRLAAEGRAAGAISLGHSGATMAAAL
ncbi:MAG TPA: hypothetical protein VKZ43_00685, partial [Trueperaceae bacterium]|nr:hypothetical protein [Trueperaceae bacterium]